MKLALENGAVLPHRAPRRLHQGGAKKLVRFFYMATFALACGAVISATDPRPTAQMVAGGKHRHIRTNFGQNCGCGKVLDSWNGAHQLELSAPRLQPLHNLLLERLQLAIQQAYRLDALLDEPAVMIVHQVTL